MNVQRPFIPKSQIVYGETVYWITVVSCLITTVGPAFALAFPEHNVLNPFVVFGDIFAGKNAADVWASGGGTFPGGHFYAKNLLTGDGFTQLGLALGCSVALPGLLAASMAYIREKAIGFMLVSLWVAGLIAFAAAGIVNLH